MMMTLSCSCMLFSHTAVLRRPRARAAAYILYVSAAGDTYEDGWMTEKASKHARELLLKEYQGVLSTQSKAMPGYPFGSVVPYCLDAEGRPLILISRIAQHTRNLQQDARCSLLVGERGADDVQSAGRLTLLADARQLEDPAEIEAAASRYFEYFPDARDYHKTHDFDFWRLQPVRARYIGGFGAIHEHGSAIAHYVALNQLPGTPPARMAGIDAEGFHLRIGARLYWLAFEQPCSTPGEVRQALVALAHAEHWPDQR
jgi:putative heme iron utilization protein